MKGLYEVHLFSRSEDIRNDPKFVPLWRFMNDVLEVNINTVETGLMSTNGADQQFEERFILDFHSTSNPSDWSDVPSADWDMESVFSIESVEHLE